MVELWRLERKVAGRTCVFRLIHHPRGGTYFSYLIGGRGLCFRLSKKEVDGLVEVLRSIGGEASPKAPASR